MNEKLGRCTRILALSLLVSGCLPRFETPSVQLASVRLADLGVSGGTLQAAIVVHNPNRYALGGTAVSYDLALHDVAASEWVPLAEGVLDATFRVPARDSARLDVPVAFAYRGIGSALLSVLRSGTISYRISGRVRVNEPVQRTVPYARTGTVVVAGER